MFGFGRKTEEEINARMAELEARLTARLNALEARQLAGEAALNQQIETILARYQQHPDERVRFLLNSIAAELQAALAKSIAEAQKISELKETVTQLYQATEATAQQLTLRAQGAAAQQARMKANLNEVHRAPWLGYVALYFKGGFTPSAQLLVGSSAPPQQCVGELNNISNYAGSVVRAGEYWLAKSSSSDVKCVYTPF